MSVKRDIPLLLAGKIASPTVFGFLRPRVLLSSAHIYGHTIITLLEHYSSYYQVPSLANLSRNKRTLKRRILMIKKLKKNSYRWSAFGVVAIIAVSSVSLLNAHADIATKA